VWFCGVVVFFFVVLGWGVCLGCLGGFVLFLCLFFGGVLRWSVVGLLFGGFVSAMLLQSSCLSHPNLLLQVPTRQFVDHPRNPIDGLTCPFFHPHLHPSHASIAFVFLVPVEYYTPDPRCFSQVTSGFLPTFCLYMDSLFFSTRLKPLSISQESPTYLVSNVCLFHTRCSLAPPFPLSRFFPPKFGIH